MTRELPPVPRFQHSRATVRRPFFYGRERELARIEARVLRNDFPEPVVLQGLPRSGKSSLAWEATMARQEALLANRRVPVWLNAGEYTDPYAMLGATARGTHDAVRRHFGPQAVLERPLRDLSLQPDATFPVRLQDYFREVRQLGFHPIIVLDEFDSARRIFQSDPAPFQTVRELGYNPTARVGLIFVSRRPIWMIEESCGISTLDGICDPIHVRRFSPAEYQRCAAAFLEWEEFRGNGGQSVWAQIHYHSGGLPYPLINGVAEAIELAGRLEARGDLAARVREYLAEFSREYFRHLQHTLQELGLFDGLVEYVRSGTPEGLSPDQLALLRQYGLDPGAEATDITAIGSGALLDFLASETERLSAPAVQAQQTPLPSVPIGMPAIPDDPASQLKRGAAFGYFRSGVCELQAKLEPLQVYLPRGFLASDDERERVGSRVLARLRAMTIPDQPSSEAFEIDSLGGNLRIGSALLQPLAQLQSDVLHRLGQLFVLHEAIHEVQGIGTHNYRGIGRSGVILEEADYWADAFALGTAALHHVHRHGPAAAEAGGRILVQYIDAHIDALRAFDCMEQGLDQPVVLPERRLRRYLIWLVQRARAAAIHRPDHIRVLLEGRLFVELAPLRGRLDGRFDKLVDGPTPDTALCVALGGRIRRVTRLALNFEPGELVAAVQNFDFARVSSMMTYVVNEHADLLVPWHGAAVHA